MSKSGKKPQETRTARSLLRAAWEAWEAGDVLTTRRYAREVLAGKRGGDDEHEALDLSKALSVEGVPVGATPEAVAEHLLARTAVPAKAYAFAGLALSIFLLLLSLAVFRYAG